MATGSQTPSTERRLSDKEFEKLLQKALELMQAQGQQAIVRPSESTESPS
jgi:hypothetical protein